MLSATDITSSSPTDAEKDMEDDNTLIQNPADTTVQSLWSTSCHYRMTRRGKILKNVSERYLREDLGFGCCCTASSIIISIPCEEDLLNLLLPETKLIICDANVLIHNMDLLEHPLFMANIVIPQTSLEECRKNTSLAHYNRCMELLQQKHKKMNKCVIFFPNVHHLETSNLTSADLRCLTQRIQQVTKNVNATITDNDKNDLRIRKVATYFGSNLSVPIVLLTDDQQCRQLAQMEQQHQKYYATLSVREYVQQLSNNHTSLLLDVVSHTTTRNYSTKNRKDLFEKHLPISDVTMGIKTGKYYQGILRCADRSSYDKCYVTIRGGSEEEDRVAISILGSQDVNRAVDGDIVAIQLHPVNQWLSSTNTTKDVVSSNHSSPPAIIAMDTAEPTIQDEDNVQETVIIPAIAPTIDNNNSKNLAAPVSMKPTGKVVGIVKRNFRQNYCGSIYSQEIPDEEENEEDKMLLYSSEREEIAKAWEEEHTDGTFTCVFFAVDKRVPPILIRTSQRDRLMGQRILVAMDSWPATSLYPLGHYVKALGTIGDVSVETQVVLHEYNIPCDPFSEKVLACLPPSDYKIEMEDNRLDLRSLPVLSIDPPGCKDIDDALHCIPLPNGNFQVGVHIADVTHYVHAGSAMDVEAARRSTSTYLVNQRLDMLPSLLTTDLCSLKGNVDRYAFSVLWEVTAEADIVHVDFRKTIIHSIGALTYAEAQAMIDQPDDSSYNDVKVRAVKRLNLLGRKFRAKRLFAGALTLASPEVKFVLDSDSLNPTDVQAYALMEANALVEEFMLLANVTVSKKILRHYPTLSVLRRHPAPSRAAFDSLIKKAKNCKGVDINIDDSKKLADSLDNAMVDSDPYFNKLLRILSTRCMSPAQYFCSGEYKPTEWHHYGLAAHVYTHFTSPIRRYADVCVHRLLAAAIGVQSLPQQMSSKTFLHDLCANMNRRHRAAQLAGRSSVQLHTLIFFAGKEGARQQEDAYVLDVDTAEGCIPSFQVIVPRYGIEGRVKCSQIDPQDENLVRDPENFCIRYKDTTIQVFDKVSVKIWIRKEADQQKELVLDLISPVFGPQAEQKLDKNELLASASKRAKN